MKTYPHEDLQRRDLPLMPEIEEAVLRVLRSGRYVGGPEVAGFEEDMCRYHGTRYCIGVSNGLDALRLILRGAIEIGRLKPGDGVLVPANTYVASVLAISDSGLRPVFVDASASTLNLDTSLLETIDIEGIHAIMPVHLYGRACWDQTLADFVARHNLFVVEDNAQAIGATWNGQLTGTFGDAAAFSFYPTKNIGAAGDAGAVLCKDKDLADAVRALANYGCDRRYHNLYQGFNCRLDPLQAAVLRVKLRHIKHIIAQRNERAEAYRSHIHHPSVLLPEIPTDGTHVYHQFVVRTGNRDRFRNYLADNGVSTDIHYATPPYLQPCYSRFANIEMPVTQAIADTCVSLPISEATPLSNIIEISEIINRYKPCALQ